MITNLISLLKTIIYKIFKNNYPIIYNKIPICPYSNDNITYLHP